MEVREIFVERTEFGSEKYYLVCNECGKRLAEIYRAGSAYQFFPVNDCEHFEWVTIGNGCFLNPENEICKPVKEWIDRAIKVYQDGTTVYLLVPRH